MQSQQYLIKLVLFLFLASSTLFARPPFMPQCSDYETDWEGFYLSGQLGGGGNRERQKFTNLNYFNTLGPTLLGTSFKEKSLGFIGGAALGYQYHTECFVIGLEGGIVSSNLQKTRRSPFFPTTDVFSSRYTCLANGKLRLGYAFDQLLFFIAGGWAGGRHTVKLIDNESQTIARLKRWSNGWSIGAGFDCKLTNCFSLGIAYDYIQLHDKNKAAFCPTCGTGVGFGSPVLDNRSYVQTLTLRLNYFFN